MLAALVGDLSSGGQREIVATTDERFPLTPPPGAEVVPLGPEDGHRLDALMASVDGVWLIAPETGHRLPRLAERVRRQGARLVGPGAAAIRRASDKGALTSLLAAARGRLVTPETRVIGRGAALSEWRATAATLGYPVVVKPRFGAGSEGVALVRGAAELERAAAAASVAAADNGAVVQRFIHGAPASVSVLAAGGRAMALGLNSQTIRGENSFTYAGGTTPFEHALASHAMDVAVRAVEAVVGLRGYVGVDLVLSDDDAVVVEINPRLTTAYLGVRAAFEENIAELALGAVAGRLPSSVHPVRSVCFTEAGEIVSSRPLRPPPVTAVS